MPLILGLETRAEKFFSARRKSPGGFSLRVLPVGPSMSCLVVLFVIQKTTNIFRPRRLPHRHIGRRICSNARNRAQTTAIAPLRRWCPDPYPHSRSQLCPPSHERNGCRWGRRRVHRLDENIGMVPVEQARSSGHELRGQGFLAIEIELHVGNEFSISQLLNKARLLKQNATFSENLKPSFSWR